MSNAPLITLLSVAILVAGLAYLRENRLRRGLQRLLVQLLSRWRTPRETDEEPQPNADCDSDDDHHVCRPADERMRASARRE